MENNVVTRKVIKREYYLLGIRKITCKKEGPHKGEQMAILDLQEERLFDDNSSTYQIQNIFASVEIANNILAKNIPHRAKVRLELEQGDGLYSRPRLIDINPLYE